MIYLDHNATTPVLPEVFEAMRPWFVERYANPSSTHPDGQRARQAIDQARSEVAALIGAPAEAIVFTGGGTESDNLALRGPQADVVTISAVEHPAITEPARYLERKGAVVHVLRMGPDGKARGPVPDDTQLLSVMLANNETGVIQPVAQLAAQAKLLGALVHTDAAQAVGKIPIDVDELGVDLLTIAGHKLYAPKGIGALYIRPGVQLEPVLRGAGHERGIRPGTENVASIVGLGAACRVALTDLEHEAERVGALRDRLWRALQPTGAVRTGAGPWLPNTLHVCFPGRSGRAILAACPEIAAGTGSACHAGVETPSQVLVAMGMDEDLALGAVRLTLGRHTTQADIDDAARMLIRAAGTT